VSGPQGIFSIDAERYLSRAPEIVVEELGRGLWTAAGGTYRTLFAEGASSVVAFNTFGTPAAARAYREAIGRTVPGKPIQTLVVTIDHLDHTGYGAALAPDAEVIGHELTAAVIAARSADGQLSVTRVVRGSGEPLDVDDVAFELHYPGPIQGSGGLAALFPEHGVLFLCGPQANARYGLFPDFHVEQYPSSLRKLLELDWQTLVPGRYGMLTRAEAERALGYFEGLQMTAQQAFASGVPIWLIDEMRRFCADALRDEWGDLDGFEEHVGPGAVRLVHHYLMGGWGLEDTQEPELVLAELR
jgi:glyoxylase-like metal-dependent hydrolase (beta-lactamase superfamily II)